MRIAIGIVAFALLTATSAFAADMPMSTPATTAPIQAVNWTGFYIGGNAGGEIAHPLGTSDFTDTSLPGFLSEFTSVPVAEQPAKGGFAGGAQGGVNWQFSPIWVGGLEADWDWMSAKYSFCRQNIGGGNVCNELGVGGGFQTVDSKTPWLATFRGRFGVAWQNWLFYGTGGGAIGRVTTDLTMNCQFGCGINAQTPILASSTSTTTKTGWVAGLGAELMLGGAGRMVVCRSRHGQRHAADRGQADGRRARRPSSKLVAYRNLRRISARRELFVPLEICRSRASSGR